MFDVWYGDIELTRLTLLIALAVLLPIQLFLCFKVKSRILRLLPAAILSLLTAALLILALAASGWDGIVYIFLAIFTGIMLFMCGVGWGIWCLIGRKKTMPD